MAASFTAFKEKNPHLLEYRALFVQVKCGVVNVRRLLCSALVGQLRGNPALPSRAEIHISSKGFGPFKPACSMATAAAACCDAR